MWFRAIPRSWLPPRPGLQARPVKKLTFYSAQEEAAPLLDLGGRPRQRRKRQTNAQLAEQVSELTSLFPALTSQIEARQAALESQLHRLRPQSRNLHLQAFPSVVKAGTSPDLMRTLLGKVGHSKARAARAGKGSRPYRSSGRRGTARRPRHRSSVPGSESPKPC